MAKKQSLSAVLRSARIGKGLTLQALGETIGVTPSAISHWEAGVNRPRSNNLKAICRALRLPIRATMEMATS